MEMDFWNETDWPRSPFSISSNWSLGVDFGAFTYDFDGMLDPTVSGHDLPMLESSPACSNCVGTATWPSSVDKGNLVNEEDNKGLRLVHLLMAAAEAIGEEDMEGKDLAWVILVRLKEVVSPSEGTNMERLAAQFMQGLQHVLQGSSGPNLGPDPPAPQAEFICAFRLLQEISPCIKFGHFTANQAIIEAVHAERGLHIIDYDIMDGMQWAPLMQALICSEHSPALRLRITALTRAHDSHRSCASVRETGRRLASFAESIGQTFLFHKCRLNSDGHFRPGAVKLVKGEVVVVNCMLNLPHSPTYSPDSVKSFLSGAKTLNPRPKVVTLVEEEQGSYGDGFVKQFMDLLHHYSAIYDSMEANEPRQLWARLSVERDLLGPMIQSSLARLLEKGHEGIGKSWSGWLVESGFKAQPVSTFNHCQAKLLIGLFGEGHNIEHSRNKLILGWKTKPLLAASVWSPPT